MLPISLTLRNFLSYRDAAPTLWLEDVHVACLCGPNGNGKSALLDAVTWALWGQARGHRQDQLIHHGQDEMFVELTFDVGGERYRVSRRYSKARRTPQSSLELAVRTGPDDFQPITGDKITETQTYLNRLINMDYETFVNSAFLVQGRADLFTMATPSQRKDVLSKVLGLGLYDRLEERAKLHGREVQGKLSAGAVVLDRLRERAGQADETKASLEEVERSLIAANAAVAGLAERLERLRERVAQLERRKAEGVELEQRKQRAVSQQAQADSEADGLDRRVAVWRRTVERTDEIEAGFAALQQSRERQRALTADAQAMVALQNELAPQERVVAEARAALERDAASQRKHVESELSPRAESMPSIDRRLAEITERVASLEARAAEAAQATADHQRLTFEAQGLREENERLAQLGKDTKAKLDLLNDHGHPHGAKCPLCDSELGPDGVERIRTSYESDIDEQRRRYADQKGRAEELDKRAKEAGVLAQTAQHEVEQERTLLGAERTRLVVQREEAERAAGQLGNATAVLRDMETALAKSAYAVDEQAAAHRLRSQIEALAYDARAVEDVDRQVRDLTRWEDERQALTSALARLDDDQAALERARVRAAEAGEEVERVEGAIAALAVELVELPSYISQRDEVAREWAAAGGERDALQTRKGALLDRMEEIRKAAAELSIVERERKSLTEEAAAYSELALAFGKGGVQALLIEAAIPRLEDEANDLLGRMTDGRMSLKLETQRARRTGGKDADAIETLEIVIADELGTRAYEMFSGGERFRVDFAIRIALSKLLAWRAGAPLPTLFIDEGFGTQDAEGRDRVLDVIKAIEDRFERILVITHMDEIKEAFPVRIEVSRGPDGSTFALS